MIRHSNNNTTYRVSSAFFLCAIGLSTPPVLSHWPTGNLIIPNENYVKFEDWLAPILVRMTVEQVVMGRRLLLRNVMISTFFVVPSSFFSPCSNNVPIAFPSSFPR